MNSFFLGLGEVLLVLLAVFVIGIVIYVISRRAGGVTIPHALMPSRQTVINILWMFISYLIVLWAFSALCPDVWHAWRGKGFWITQLLLISMIGLLASMWIRGRHIRWLAWIPGVMAIALTVVSIYNNWPTKGSSKDLVDNSIVPIVIKQDKIVTQVTVPVADLTVVDDTLMNDGDSFHHHIKDGYHFHTSATALYYYQPESMEKEVVGNGKGYSKDLSTVKDVDISFYKKPIIVICTTVKNGQCKWDDK